MISIARRLQTLKNKRTEKRGGFTLLEISIVILIIAILTAGIFAGEDLYNAAKVRKTIAEFQEFQTAASVFRTRYNCIPGDCRNFAKFGGKSRSNASNYGDGDWSIEYTHAQYGINYEMYQNAEPLFFWADLYDAGLINVTSSPTNFAAFPGNITPETGLASYLPKTLWGDDVFWLITRDINEVRKHYLYISQVNNLGSSGRVDSVSRTPIPVHLAKQIDEQLDDGKPDTGKITDGYVNQSGGTSRWLTNNYECRTNATPSEYDLTGDGCSLRFEFRF